MLLRCPAAIAILTAVATVPAADDPLNAFPADTGVVLRLGSPTEVTTKAKTFLNRAAPQFALLADQIGPGLGSLIGNPTLAGVDATSDLYFAVLPRKEMRPAVVFAVRATDAAALKQALGQGYSFTDHEDWVVYSLDAESVKSVQSLIGGAGDSIRKLIPESLGPSFRDGEFAAFLNASALRNAYQRQIDEARKRFIDGADEAQKEIGPPRKAIRDESRKLVGGLLTIVEDTIAVAGHIAIADDALRGQAIAVMKPDTESARFLAKQTPSDFPLLSKLPAARPAYFAFSGDFGELIAASTRTSLKTYGESEQLRKSFEDLQKFQFSEIVGLFEFGDAESGAYRSISLMRIDRPNEFLDVVRELIQAMGEVEAEGLQQDITLRPEAETVEGVKVDVIKVTTSDPNDEQAAAAQQFQKILFGEDGITEQIAVVDGLFLQTTGKGMMATAIKSVRGENPDDAANTAMKATRSAFDGQANVLASFDLPRLLGGGLQLAVEAEALPLPIDPKEIENVNLSPSYTGISVVAASNEVRLRGHMPASQVGGLVELLMVLQKAAPQRNHAE